MSADAWRVCFKCGEKELKNLNKLLDEKKDKYGKVPYEEWQKIEEETKIIQDKIEHFENNSENQTLREDYEVYTDEDGQFAIGYSCSCAKCGFRWIYKHTEDLTKVES